MKTYFLLFLFLLICLKDYSQCNTSLLTSNGDSKVFGAALENLYTYAGYNDNGDYAQGSYLVNGHLVVFSTTKNGTLFTQWQLVLTVKAIYFDLLVPRQAMVFFENGSVLDLTASTFKQKELKSQL
jgi:hypothetical protein